MFFECDNFKSSSFVKFTYSILCLAELTSAECLGVLATGLVTYHSFLLQIRLQLETLLAEKARLAHENSVYARENRFLREIVEYHQLTMQDVIYVDEGIEEVTEVYPTQVLPRTVSLAATPATPKSAPTTSTSIVVPESCPVVQASPNMLSRSSLSNRAKPPPPTFTEE